MVCSIPDVCIAYMLFLTLPVTSVERRFSELKLIIKNYLRSTISQERLSGLRVLSVENEIARSIGTKRINTEIIKTLASYNATMQ